ncbi:threonine ammonia-lyase [Ottowia testudinis]|uniref:Pyridoxal-phosphate dependent enzyme n=1 Tax=Ottowia testudinis TaxID=2816950 RepID=A0A975CF29_9BURK|nr:pyridoxal-phosphate dependent enzyme [Ottowia testudinis]QTD44652.1 pyridoxal-phosphate dependent enzyme [Ottowia testudinis]
MPVAPTLSLPDIEAAHERLRARVLETPVWRWQTGAAAALGDTAIWLKLELWQKTGTFKLRGALNVMDQLGSAELARGVTAVSAGNHAMAVAQAAQMVGTSAKLVMLAHSSPARVDFCRALGAEVLQAPDIHTAFAWADRIQQDEGRCLIHPFEGPGTALGTAGVGLELMRQLPQLDAVVVPVGGGGLCAGIAAAVKQIKPGCKVYGVEPAGANSMQRSLAAGSPQKLAQVSTIADSLGAPFALPYSFGLCQQYVDEVVTVTDDALRAAMLTLFTDMKLVCEPATAASTAALLGPLRQRLQGQVVGLIVCGANIDAARFSQLIQKQDASA